MVLIIKSNFFVNADWDKVQEEFKCCGVVNATDWTNAGQTIPSSCFTGTGNCTEATAYTVGCYTELKDFVKDKIGVIGFVGLGFAFIQVCVNSSWLCNGPNQKFNFFPCKFHNSNSWSDLRL
jgi:hypothetical protein